MQMQADYAYNYFRQYYSALLEEARKSEDGASNRDLETVAFANLPTQVLCYYLLHIDQKDAQAFYKQQAKLLHPDKN